MSLYLFSSKLKVRLIFETTGFNTLLDYSALWFSTIGGAAWTYSGGSLGTTKLNCRRKSWKKSSYYSIYSPFNTFLNVPCFLMYFFFKFEFKSLRVLTESRFTVSLCLRPMYRISEFLANFWSTNAFISSLFSFFSINPEICFDSQNSESWCLILEVKSIKFLNFEIVFDFW